MRWCLIFTAVATVACAARRATPERPLVKSVKFKGVEAVSKGDLEEKLATQGTGWLPWDEPHFLDPDALATDRRRIERYYRSQGYYQAKVTRAEAVPVGKNKVKVEFEIAEGQPVRTAEVTLEGMQAAPEVGAKLKSLPLQRGQVFSEEKYDAARAALESALHQGGYAQGEVQQSAELRLTEREADVTYEVDPGSRYRFGRVFVAGANAVPRGRIRGEAEVAVQPGAVFDESALARAQARVFDLGVFGGVRVSPGAPDEERKVIPVVVSVREAPFRTVRAGPGIALSARQSKVYLSTGWTHRNWFGDLRRLSLDAQVGWAWLPSTTSKSFFPVPGDDDVRNDLIGLISADFVQPGVLTRRVDLNLRLEVERGLEPAFTFTAERFRIGLPLRLGRAWTVAPSYNLEVYQLKVPRDADAAENAFGSSITAPPILQSCPVGECILSYLEQRLAWDGRDDAVRARRGLYLAVALQEGFSALGFGTFRYLRVLPEVRGYIPLSKRLVLASYLRVGAMLPTGPDRRTPIVQLFTSGGPNSMRGYSARRFAPMTPSERYGLLPVGGNGLVEGSVELRFGIRGDLGGALFLDYGNVTRTHWEALNPRLLQAHLGVGLRYQTPFGPLRLDVAGRLPRREGNTWRAPPVPVFMFGPEGQVDSGARVGIRREPLVAVQLSLGEAF